MGTRDGAAMGTRCRAEAGPASGNLPHSAGASPAPFTASIPIYHRLLSPQARAALFPANGLFPIAASGHQEQMSPGG